MIVVVLMTRILCILAVFFGMLSVAHAQLQRPISGVVAASSGAIEVRYQEPDGTEVGRIAGIGDPIYLDDEIITGPDTSLQILLKDQTVFTIGPNAVLVFDEFIYDPQSNEPGSLSASVKKGAFKFVSGKISKKSPKAMILKLPNATASIRGTTVAGRVQEDGESDVILLSGAINVTSASSPLGVDIFQSGWGANISAAGAVSDPFLLTTDLLDQILSEASVEAPAAAQSQEGGTTSTAQAASNAVGEIALTVEAQVIADFTANVTETLAANGETEVSVNDLFGLILGNSDLLAQLEAQGLDLTDAPTDLNYAYLDTRLVSMLASGAGPEFMRLLSDGAGGHYINHFNVPPDMANLISDAYSGSVRFQSSGLAFAPQADATSASGTASYDYSISYDDATATGSFTISNLEIDGVSFGSGTDSFNNLSLAGLPQVGYEDDMDMVLAAGQEVFEVELASMNLSDGGNNATAKLNSSLGSITNGVDVVDGILGSTNIMVENNADFEKRARVEKYEVGRRE